ncbi:MAG: hypothetical protein WA702_23730 [Bradyrhizobium sp.]|jgi:hypothetical protein|uniref:hypothetical protein n=1 Tax=Bradyrhizobium sp. TaxID=376 RepID=UPI003C7C072F
MTVPLRLVNQTAQPVRGAILPRSLLPTEELSGSEHRLEPSAFELSFRIFATFRAHPHINNVLTHISRAKWHEVERALDRILDQSMTSDGLSPLEENLVELMVGERGVTGKIVKPYFQAAIRRLLEPSLAERLIRHVTALYLELEWKVQHPTPAPLPGEAMEDPDRGAQSQ